MQQQPQNALDPSIQQTFIIQASVSAPISQTSSSSTLGSPKPEMGKRQLLKFQIKDKSSNRNHPSKASYDINEDLTNDVYEQITAIAAQLPPKEADQILRRSRNSEGPQGTPRQAQPSPQQYATPPQQNTLLVQLPQQQQQNQPQAQHINDFLRLQAGLDISDAHADVTSVTGTQIIRGAASARGSTGVRPQRPAVRTSQPKNNRSSSPRSNKRTPNQPRGQRPQQPLISPQLMCLSDLVASPDNGETVTLIYPPNSQVQQYRVFLNQPQKSPATPARPQQQPRPPSTAPAQQVPQLTADTNTVHNIQQHIKQQMELGNSSQTSSLQIQQYVLHKQPLTQQIIQIKQSPMHIQQQEQFQQRDQQEQQKLQPQIQPQSPQQQIQQQTRPQTPQQQIQQQARPQTPQQQTRQQTPQPQIQQHTRPQTPQQQMQHQGRLQTPQQQSSQHVQQQQQIQSKYFQTIAPHLAKAKQPKEQKQYQIKSQQLVQNVQVGQQQVIQVQQAPQRPQIQLITQQQQSPAFGRPQILRTSIAQTNIDSARICISAQQLQQAMPQRIFLQPRTGQSVVQEVQKTMTQGIQTGSPRVQPNSPVRAVGVTSQQIVASPPRQPQSNAAPPHTQTLSATINNLRMQMCQTGSVSVLQSPVQQGTTNGANVSTVSGSVLIVATEAASVTPTPPPTPPPPPEKVLEGHQVICFRCGACNDYYKCYRCKAPISKNAKLFRLKPELSAATPEKQQEKTKGTITLITTATFNNHKEKKKKKMNNDEPEILVLSSDEEDCTEKTDTPPVQPSASNRPSISGQITSKSEPIYTAEEMAEYTVDPVPKETSEQYASVYVKSIRIGNSATERRGMLLVYNDGLAFHAISETTGEDTRIYIERSSLKAVLVHYSNADPILVIYVRRPTAARIRKQLGLVDVATFYYDPCSSVQAFRRIVISAERIPEEAKLKLKESLDGILTEIYSAEKCEILSKASLPVPDPSDRPLLNFEKHAITKQDYTCLAEQSYLNDVIIDFYLDYLMHRILSKEDAKRTHLFSTFFYNRLTKPAPGESTLKDSPAEKRHKRVRKWTKNVSIFEKDFIIIPINENSHWFLAVICFPHLTCPVRYKDNIPVGSDDNGMFRQPPKKAAPRTRVKVEFAEEQDRDEAEPEDDLSDGDTDEEVPVSTDPSLKQPCILIFDSLRGSNPRGRVVATLRDYLKVEYKWKTGLDRQFTKDNFKGSVLKVPQQNNFYDCGTYVLQYVESFFEAPLTDYRLPIRSLGNWFTDDIMDKKRQQIGAVIQSLMQEQGVDPGNFCLPDLTRPLEEDSSALDETHHMHAGDHDGNCGEEYEDEMYDEEHYMEEDPYSDEDEEDHASFCGEEGYYLEQCDIEQGDEGEEEEQELINSQNSEVDETTSKTNWPCDQPVQQVETWAQVEDLLNSSKPADAPTRQSLKSVRIHRKQPCDTDDTPQSKRSKS